MFFANLFLKSFHLSNLFNFLITVALGMPVISEIDIALIPISFFLISLRNIFLNKIPYSFHYCHFFLNLKHD